MDQGTEIWSLLIQLYENTPNKIEFIRGVWKGSVGRSLDSDADDPGSNPTERIISTKSYPPSTQSVDILGNQRHVHLIPRICGRGSKRSPVLEMKVTVYVYIIIIIIIRIYMAINQLMRRKTMLNRQSTS